MPRGHQIWEEKEEEEKERKKGAAFGIHQEERLVPNLMKFAKTLNPPFP